MRRKEREVTGQAELLEIIRRCKVCRIGMRDEDGIYVLPMNFGYRFSEGKLTLYFHCAREGRKVEALRRDPEVGFEMDCAHRLITAGTACGYGYGYQSIVGGGKVVFLEQSDEKKEALRALMLHQTGKEFAFTAQQTEAVCVFRLDAEQFTGKKHE